MLPSAQEERHGQETSAARPAGGDTNGSTRESLARQIAGSLIHRVGETLPPLHALHIPLPVQARTHPAAARPLLAVDREIRR